VSLSIFSISVSINAAVRTACKIYLALVHLLAVALYPTLASDMDLVRLLLLALNAI
jgi:hypothetical protein